MTLHFQRGGSLIDLEARPVSGGWIVTLPGGTDHAISALRSSATEIEITEHLQQSPAELGARGPIAEHRFRVPVARTERGIEIAWAGRTYIFAIADTIRASAAKHKASGALTAAMPGVVVDVMVVEGQEVAQYQPVAVIEAMKVMATLEAPFAGIVSKVSAAKGSQVALGDLVVEITPAAAA